MLKFIYLHVFHDVDAVDLVELVEYLIVISVVAVFLYFLCAYVYDDGVLIVFCKNIFELSKYSYNNILNIISI